MSPTAHDSLSLSRLTRLSALAAVLTLALKITAWLLTGSVGMLSDALETLVNLATATLAILMVAVATRPADEDHPYGHGKAEYFSSGVEGALILFGGAGIAIAAVRRLLAPQPLEQIGVGLALAGVAALLNLAVAGVLMRGGRRLDSATLEASAHHLYTDVWTTLGVFVGVGAVAVTGRLWVDPLVGLVISASIVRTGIGIVRRAVTGLMDSALPAREREALQKALAPHIVAPVQVHALRSRQAGARRFVSMHVLVPGDWTVQRGHELLERIEADVRGALPGATVLTHLESLDDPASWEDITLDRGQPPSTAR